MTINPPMRVGLLVGRERRFPDALIEEVNQRDTGIFCEYVMLGGTRMAETPPYSVLIDRVSHEVSYYATFLKTTALAGAIIINNPFWRAADDTFFGASLITRLGLASPRTMALPNHRYVDGVALPARRPAPRLLGAAALALMAQGRA